MKSKDLILGAVVTVLVLTSCAGPSEGYVKNKSYTGPFTTMQCSGKPLICVPIYHPADYEFDIWSNLSDEKSPHGWIEVDSVDYHNYNIGDHYPSRRGDNG